MMFKLVFYMWIQTFYYNLIATHMKISSQKTPQSPNLMLNGFAYIENEPINLGLKCCKNIQQILLANPKYFLWPTFGSRPKLLGKTCKESTRGHTLVCPQGQIMSSISNQGQRRQELLLTLLIHKNIELKILAFKHDCCWNSCLNCCFSLQQICRIVVKRKR